MFKYKFINILLNNFYIIYNSKNITSLFNFFR